MSWGITKPRQAVAFAQRLSARQGPALLGADANTPRIDAADFAATRTHWHTGSRHLHGEPGDDLLFGPGKIHPLQDALRRWLAGHPDETAQALITRPARWRSLTAPVSGATHREPADVSTPSGSPVTGPCGISPTSMTKASPPAAITPVVVADLTGT